MHQANVGGGVVYAVGLVQVGHSGSVGQPDDLLGLGWREALGRLLTLKGSQP